MKKTAFGLKFLIFALLCTALSLPIAAKAATAADTYNKTQKYLINTLTAPNVGSIGGEWGVLGLARSEANVASGFYDSYYSKVCSYVKENINSDSQLHRAKSTDNSRIILAVTAIGKDAQDVAGYNLIAGLSDMDYLKKQGINGPIWALIASDSAAYDIPKVKTGGTQTTRDALVAEILDRQLSDGGWALSGTRSDPDITSMALQAIAPYRSKNEKVKTAVSNAVAFLSKSQNQDGTYSSWGKTNSESSSQVIVALTSLGIDPAKDSRFIKNSKSVIDGLLKYSMSNGAFSHELTAGGAPAEANQMATEQAFYALTAYIRMTFCKTALYDMTDLKAPAFVYPAVGAKLSLSGLNYKVTASASAEKAGTVTLTGASGSVAYLIVPASITVDGANYKVTKIAANAFAGNKKLTNVTVGSNVVSIGKQAFKNCINLVKVTKSSTVKVGKNAFKGCGKLKK